MSINLFDLTGKTALIAKIGVHGLGMAMAKVGSGWSQGS
jgi:hypothetical protein